MAKDGNRRLDLDLVRILLTLLVIIGHGGNLLITTEYGGIDYLSPMSVFPLSYTLTTACVKIIYAFHMPLFMSLSGITFFMQLDRKRFSSLRDLVKEKVSRLLIPFVIVTVFYCVPIKYMSGYYVGSDNPLSDAFVGQLLMQGNTHLWYLPTLFLLSIIAYVVHKLIPAHTNWIIPIFGVLHFMTKYMPVMLIKEAMMYGVYFFCGSLWSKKRIVKLPCGVMLLLSLAAFAANYLCGSKSLFLGKCLSFVCAFCAIEGVYAFAKMVAKKRHNVLSKVEKVVLAYSYELYLYSDPINYLVLYAAFDLFGASVFITSAGYAALFLTRIILSFAIALVIGMTLRSIRKRLANK